MVQNSDRLHTILPIQYIVVYELHTLIISYIRSILLSIKTTIPYAIPTGATISVDESGKTLHTTAVCEQFFL